MAKALPSSVALRGARIPFRRDPPTFRSGPVQYANTIDGFGLERLELVKSQGSVLYGSDALGGTVNALSISSDYREQEEGFFQHGQAFYRFDTNSYSHIGRVQHSIGEGDKWGLTVGGTWKDFGDIRSNFFGRMSGTGHPELNLDLKLEWSLADNFHLTLAHQQINQDDINRWHSTTANPRSWEGLAPGTFNARVLDQERSLSYLKAEHELATGPIYKYTATFSYQTSQDSEAWIAGLEAEASYRLSDSLTLSGFLTYQYGDATRPTFIGSSDDLTASLSAGWQVTENLDFTLSLQNLTDEDYRIHGSGLNEPVFGAILTTRYSW